MRHNEYKPTTARQLILDNAKMALDAIVLLFVVAGVAAASYAWVAS